MACDVELGDNTLVTLDAEGVCTLFCSSPCLQDFHVVQFLQQTYDELAAGIKMRGMGAAADEPEEEKPDDA